MASVHIARGSPVYEFRAGVAPVARVLPGDEIVVETGDEAYHALTAEMIDAGRFRSDRANGLTGPIWIEGAEPGDAIGFAITRIEVGQTVHVVYVARWRRGAFGTPISHVASYSVIDGVVALPNGGRIAPRPMIGCIGVAPAEGVVSGLSPCAPTGGNMDLVEAQPSATVWLPCRVAGGLLSLGDLHARMGRGEPVGAGLECAGVVHGTVRLAKGRRLTGPVIQTAHRIAFVGTHDEDPVIAERIATTAAWAWLMARPGMTEEPGFAICAALLEIDAGGPAGAIVVAGFDLEPLHTAGVELIGWPLEEDGIDGRS